MKGLRFLSIVTVLTLVLVLLPSRVETVDADVQFIGNIWGENHTNPNSPPPNFDMYWNQLTPENAGKWRQIEPEGGKHGDEEFPGLPRLQMMYDYAKDHDMPFRQHTFIWGHESGQADWMCEPGYDMRLEATEVITAVCTAMPEIDFIDVVNEPLHDPPCYKNQLGSDAGWGWVVWSFQRAQEGCPNSQLCLNDYGILNDGSADKHDLWGYIEIINILDGQGLIDCIGVQGHGWEDAPLSLIQENMQILADNTSADLPIYLTEYDVERSNDQQQLDIYEEQFTFMYNHPRVEGITMWGYVEGAMWKADAFLMHTDADYTKRPALQYLWDNYINVEPPEEYEDLRMWRPENIDDPPEPSWRNIDVADEEYRVMANFYNLKIPEQSLYIVEGSNNQWEMMDSAQTIRAYLDDGDFDVTEFTGYSYMGRDGDWVDTRHWPSSYPAIYKGCHWGSCSRVDGGPFPMRLWDLESLDSEWETGVVPGSWAERDGAVWNAAYDIWLDIGTKPYWEDNLPEAAHSVGQPYGTELMIWNDYKNLGSIIEPSGDLVQDNITLDGIPGTWDVWIGVGEGVDYHNDETVQWNIVSFVRNGADGTGGAFDIDAKPFVEYLVEDIGDEWIGNVCPIAYDDGSHSVESPGSPCADDRWWITSAQAGFEIWWNGKGLQSESFSVRPKANTLVSHTGRRTGTDDPLGRRTKLHWRDHIQLFKMDVECSEVPDVTYVLEGEEFSVVDPIGPTDGTKSTSGVMEIVYNEGNTYDFYTVVEPLRELGDLVIHGNAVVTVTVDCDGDIDTYTENIYVDPSGWVRTVEGAPIAGATVTLYRSDTAGGPFTQVPDGSDIMSPTNRTNPDLTDESGAFGWDVIAGYYKVRAEAGDCHAPGDPSTPYVETEVLEIPPPIFDLDLILECPKPEPQPDLPVELHVFSDWGAGYCAEVIVTNNTPEPVEWLVHFPVDGTFYDHWNFSYTPSGDGVDAWGVWWNKVLDPDESTHSVGFCANRGGSPPGGEICEVTYNVRQQWDWGFTADITLKNIGPTTINGWTLSWTFPNGQNMYQAWSSVIVGAGPNASLMNASWNGVLGPGQRAEDFGGPIGFNAYHYGANSEPTDFTLNGQPCVVK
jgi:endo-1,4-beta-xylanase